eukprot:scaffold130874_cov36-Phaeocystis_antarctica.AAC.2
MRSSRRTSRLQQRRRGGVRSAAQARAATLRRRRHLEPGSVLLRHVGPSRGAVYATTPPLNWPAWCPTSSKSCGGGREGGAFPLVRGYLV